MRVLFIGPYRDNSGWAVNAINQILALDAVGVDVVPRCVKTTSRPAGELPARLLELEAKPDGGCDIVVQNILPSYMERGEYRRHIAYYFCETAVTPQCWRRHIELMDESWVPNKNARDAEIVGIDSFEEVTSRPVIVIPCSSDVLRFAKHYKPHKIKDEAEGRFLFYTIGEGRRKNLPAIIRAFHREFKPHEPVELIIKTSIPGLTPDQAREAVRRDIATIKEQMGLRPTASQYKPEIIITEHLPDEEILRLHATGDCFVSASHGEGWNLGAFTAMAMGRQVIYSDVGGHREFLNPKIGWPVEVWEEPVHGLLDGIYTAEDTWWSPNIVDLCQTMRMAYEMRDSDHVAKMTLLGRERAFDFTYDRVGRLMKESLTRSLERGN